VRAQHPSSGPCSPTSSRASWRERPPSGVTADGVSLRPLLIGHRGSPRVAPENTIAAFNAALAAGLDGIETDVQRTADGELVLDHDRDLAGGHHISAMTLGELRVAAPSVPLVGDLVALLQDRPEARLNLELKAAVPHEDGRADDLCEELARWPHAVQR